MTEAPEPPGGRTAHGWPTPTGQPVAVGPAVPLTSAYCAERAATAITKAETDPDLTADRWLKCADAWRTLACSLATNAAMNRPRDDERRR